MMIHCCDHVLMTKPQLSNPVKLVIQVLNYARKHDFPERRSAFTYWEDECPSRIDLGKDKYGGPFTVEEVENVKTVLKLVPLISCIAGTLVASKTTMHGYYDFQTCETKNVRFYFSLVRIVVLVSWLPIYHFLIYPFFYNLMPSMLRRIGVGICLIILSQLFSSAVYFFLIDIFNLTDTTFAKTENEALSVSEWLILSSYLLRDASIVIVVSITVEFSMAQAPWQVRGLITTVALLACGLFWVVYVSVHHYIRAEWVRYIVHLGVLVAFFILFVFVSKWYKLRKRNDVIPYHMFAENQFESNCRQEYDWLKDHGYFESSTDSNPESE